MRLRLIIALLIIAGIGVSVWDYKRWRYEETRNYGQGPETVKPMTLGKLYQNKTAGFRIRYPEEWVVEVAPRFTPVGTGEMKLSDVISDQERARVVKLGEMSIGVEFLKKNFPDVVDDEVKKLPVKLSREREYVKTDMVEAAVLTWEVDGKVWQRAITSWGEKVLIMDVAKTAGEWKNWETTFWEMYKSLVLI